MSDIKTGFKSCDGCIVPPVDFPLECAKRLIADVKLLYAGEGFSDPQCTFMCVTTIQAWAGQFVPEGDVVPPQPKSAEAPDAKKGLAALEAAVSGGMKAAVIDWKSILKLAIDVLLKLLAS